MRVFFSTVLFLFTLLPFTVFAACTSVVISFPPSLKFNDEKNIGPMSAARSLLLDFFATKGIKATIGPRLPWSRQLAELEAGNTDVVAPLLKTPERESKFVFTDSWMKDRHGVIVRKDHAFKYTSPEDLDDLQGAYLNGAAFPQPFRRYIETSSNLTPVYNLRSLSKMLNQKRVQFILVPIGSVFDGIPMEMQDGRFVVLPASVISTPLYIAFSNRSPCKELIPDLNAFIKARTNSEQLN